ncbi:MAG TPA: energy transducer TonB [Candidatus Rubrimentiphilum sp.]|nr:energy transducer TonB [Candidatus Rubrimentiphilum sp.]
MLLAITLQPATPAPNVPCDRDATVSQQVSPDYPESARESGIGQVTAGIRVYLTPLGKVAALRVLTSSGNGDLDQAAIRAAAESTYLPRIKNCKPTFGLYLFKVTFDPNR